MKKTGLIGKKLGHSLSPQIHAALYRLAGTNGRYSLFEVKEDGIAALLDDLEAKGYTGVNVTIPYKKTVSCRCWMSCRTRSRGHRRSQYDLFQRRAALRTQYRRLSVSKRCSIQTISPLPSGAS